MPQTHGIMLKKPAGSSLRPTQFTFLSLKTEGGTGGRPMSIATSSTRPNLEYAVRVSDFPPSGRSPRCGPARRQRKVRGPFGRFLLREDRPAVLLAGGIGITPLGVAEYATDNRLPIPLRFVYSNRSEEDIA